MNEPSASPAAILATPRALIWRRVLDNGSLEFATASPSTQGFELAGTIVALHEGEPLEVKYRIDCYPDWRTLTVSVQQRFGNRCSALLVSTDEAGRWSDQHAGLIDPVNGCLDADLELSPITNTLPINRLKLAVGEQSEIAVAWIRFPSLKIVRARQSYERLSSNTYRYRSLESGFTADIDVDDVGLAIRYAGIWERVAESIA